MDRKKVMGMKKTTISANHASREFLHKLNELRWSKTLVDIVLTGDSDDVEEKSDDKGEKQRFIETKIFLPRICDKLLKK